MSACTILCLILLQGWGYWIDYDDENDDGDGHYNDAGDDDYGDHDHYHDPDGTTRFLGNQSFWYTMFWQLTYLFPLLIFDEMYWKEIYFDIQFAYMHRNFAGPSWKAGPTNIENLEFHKEETKGQTKSDKEDQTGLRYRLKEWINLLDIRVNGLVNI